jgi:DNA-directed RNA polymerase subunit RPC12/RpoP
MTVYICKNCGYRFESKNDQEGKKCPYCDEKTLIREPNAEELIEEN